MYQFLAIYTFLFASLPLGIGISVRCFQLHLTNTHDGNFEPTDTEVHESLASVFCKEHLCSSGCIQLCEIVTKETSSPRK